MTEKKSDRQICPNGITIRDWFAGMALAGWISGPLQGDAMDDFDVFDESFREHTEMVAEACYMYADAMLAERERVGRRPGMVRKVAR